MATRYALTTVDNPFNPFDDFLQWYEWDRSSGYDTPSYLGRVVKYSDQLSDADQSVLVSQAIDEILAEHGDSIYRKVSEEYEPDPPAVLDSGPLRAAS